MALTKRQVWLRVHQEQVECPGCKRTMTRRSLRWRHECRKGHPIFITDRQAEQRRLKYVALSLSRFQTNGESVGVNTEGAPAEP